LIDLSWNSSRLEGNTYSLLDTKRLIELGQEAEGRAHLEAQMILNHKDAIEFLVSTADEIGFNRYTILNLHALLANNLLADPAAAGRLRYIGVGIERSTFHPLKVTQLIEESFDQILATAAAITDPFEQAFFVMVQLPYLQPFDDVNKRVSRLAANIPLIKGNLSPLSFADVPRQTYTEAVLGVYELTKIDLLKDVFIWAYERSAAGTVPFANPSGNPIPSGFATANSFASSSPTSSGCR
jgi:Fic family protein